MISIIIYLRGQPNYSSILFGPYLSSPKFRALRNLGEVSRSDGGGRRGQALKIKVNKRQVLLDVSLTLLHKVCDPHMTAVIHIKAWAALKALQRPVLDILDIEITKDDCI